MAAAPWMLFGDLAAGARGVEGKRYITFDDTSNRTAQATGAVVHRPKHRALSAYAHVAAFNLIHCSGKRVLPWLRWCRTRKKPPDYYMSNSSRGLWAHPGGGGGGGLALARSVGRKSVSLYVRYDAQPSHTITYFTITVTDTHTYETNARFDRWFAILEIGLTAHRSV